MVYTDIGRMSVESRNKYFNELMEEKHVGIPFCQLGEFLLYCYWKSVFPKAGHLFQDFRDTMAED